MTRVAARTHLRTALAVIGLLGAPLVGTAAADVTVPGNYGSIQSAIDAVVGGNLADGTTINVQPGTYFEALSIRNTNRSVTLRGVGGSGATVVDAGGRGIAALTVFRVSGQIVVRGLTFRNAAPPSVEGGGFMIRESSPSLADCVFESNSAYRGGGGSLYASNATFTGCVIRNNTARHFGGGVYIAAGSRPVFTNCDLTGNTSGTGGPGVGNNGAGGGVFAHDSSPTFRGARISGNASKFAAGGIFHQGIYGSAFGVATLLVEDSDVADNVSSQYSPSENPAEGGGMHVEDNATATLTRVRVLRNRANTGAGLNVYRGRYDVVDSVIDANIAAATASQPTQTGFGGGIAATSNNVEAPLRPGSVVNLTRTLVRNNTSVVTGGGIAIFGDNFSAVRASLSLASSVVSGNQSQIQGGGGLLVNRADAFLGDSLIIGNTVSGAGSSPSGGGMLITAGSRATISGTTVAQNTAAQYGGGVFVDNGSNLQMNGSRIYNNTANGGLGGGLFVGPANTVGTVQNSVIADNTGYQIVENLCPSTSLNFLNNTITPKVGNADLYVGICGSGTTASTIAQFNGAPSGRASGNNSNLPRFVHFLTAPAAGTQFTLAWSAGRATSATITGGVGTINGSTGTRDVTPAGTTTYSLTAAASGANGGNYGAVAVGVTVVQPPAPTFLHRVQGDFNGDGKADVSVFRPSTGVWYVLGGSTVIWGGSIDIPLAGDFDGDGKADVAVFRPSTGSWYLLRSTAGSVQYTWGGSIDTPVVADYDGDGTSDVAVFRRSTGAWYVLLSSTGTGVSHTWGGSIDIPVPADYDGDGKADIAVFRPSTGTWYVLQSSSGTGISYTWGGSIDTPVPADYDGDGKADIGVFRPSTGGWYLLRSSAGSINYSWGGSIDTAVPADYDGDGKTDIAVFRASTGNWYVLHSSTISGVGHMWGGDNDVPILKR